ncbi:KpsF/GutQ family sugar-phosphate isomerase [Lacticaseibacillus rhamnosus]|uniref:KpsF/GutQ family sugar-phosphate isomerase n=1 Tax=Lacticaseibacillus rhamnosus TaxID=47715 RepID=UPI000665AF8E|nr:SIS domain-containing protein [Lacticaseibacillus rhamnosus]NYZ81028.1 SIS domain-containing protein [Lacticaseibacillus rhamnosus]NYZ83422.1 SIS domain-containing protein [Lacticaseibacillus rhamnosus]NYZ90735.1 SIS domain-containing protein [Lacticaseibacillus rhamnosus]NYZ98413.1 SIS domain-containing protein [Lacticaseibacillus rhamnosus]NZA15000.1 SIS domain-containing protein [Lacticaseibacillus rhamnosus]
MKENKLDLVHTYMQREIAAMQLIESQINDVQYCSVIDKIMHLTGRLVFMGVGKTGHIGVKLAATFASLGTPAIFVHATEAMHGDMGMITSEDLVILISNSGETKETLAPLPSLKRIGASTVAFTGQDDSHLAQACESVLTIPVTHEADDLGLAPTSSSTAALMVGDALACTISRLKGFTASDFALYHPGGALGQKLLKQGSLE